MKRSELKTEEYNPYYYQYIQLVPDEWDIVKGLEKSMTQVLDFFNTLTEEQGNFKYAEGKWSIKEVLQHIIDNERVFSYRALRFSRKDKEALPGYDQDNYVPMSKTDRLILADVILDYKNVRMASISLFKSMDEDMLQHIGNANGSPMSARVAAYILIGHEIHHVKVIQERYL